MVRRGRRVALQCRRLLLLFFIFFFLSCDVLEIYTSFWSWHWRRDSTRRYRLGWKRRKNKQIESYREIIFCYETTVYSLWFHRIIPTKRSHNDATEAFVFIMCAVTYYIFNVFIRISSAARGSDSRVLWVSRHEIEINFTIMSIISTAKRQNWEFVWFRLKKHEYA